MRILIVEDDEALARMLQRVLEGSGHPTVTTADGESGVGLAADRSRPW